MSTTKENAVQAGADLLAEEAKRMGIACGLPKGMETVLMLERALAIAWTDVSMFMGANPTRERMMETIRTMRVRAHREVSNDIRDQHILRAGHNPQAVQKH